MSDRWSWGQAEWDDYFAGRRHAAGLDDPPPPDLPPPSPREQGIADEKADRYEPRTHPGNPRQWVQESDALRRHYRELAAIQREFLTPAKRRWWHWR